MFHFVLRTAFTPIIPKYLLLYKEGYTIVALCYLLSTGYSSHLILVLSLLSSSLWFNNNILLLLLSGVISPAHALTPNFSIREALKKIILDFHYF